MRLIFINRFYFPDQSATSQLLTDLAEFLVGDGRLVNVVTSRSLYNDPAARLARQETVAGVSVHRLSISRFGRSSALGRALDFLSFYVSCTVFLLGFLNAGDVVICKTDPPLISVFVTAAVRFKRAMMINWLQDVYPEIATAFGMGVAKGPIGVLLRAVRDHSLRAATLNVVIGEDMAKLIKGRGVERARVQVIPNWTDDETISKSQSPAQLREAWGLSEAFVVGYSGNLGRAHEYKTLLDAAERLKNQPKVKFLFIGGGHHLVALTEAIRERGLERAFVFQPYQDRAALGQSLRAADVHWVSLRPGFNGLILPSKIYGLFAAGRPIIVVSEAGDEMSRLVRDERAGLAVEVGDAVGLAAAISTLAQDPELTRTMGEEGRRLSEERFAKRRALAAWASLLDQSDAETRASLEQD